MKIFRGLSTNRAQPATSPFPLKSGIFIEFRGGDFCHPAGSGDWFKPPYFAKVYRRFISWPVVPFVSWRFGKRAGYIGAKIWGVDSPAYKNWLPEHEVYDGSQAFMISIRPFATLED